MSSHTQLDSNSAPAGSVWHRLATFVGFALLIVTGTVLSGWVTQSWALVRVLPTAPPMRFNTAVCVGLLGLAFLQLGRRLEWVTYWLGLLVATFAVATISQDLTRSDWGLDNLLWSDRSGFGPNKPGRMAPNTALCFLLMGYGLAVLLPFRRETAATEDARRWRFLAACLAGSLVQAIGGVSAIGYCSGLEATYGWGGNAGMAIHTAAVFTVVGSLLCGLAIAGATRTAPGGRRQLPGWLPLPAGLVVVTIALALSQALYWEEVKFSRREQQQLLDNLVVRLRDAIENRRCSFERMAGRLQLAEPPTAAQWSADVRQYMRHFPELRAFTWIDASGRIKWSVGNRPHELGTARNLSSQSALGAARFEQLGSQSYIICPIVCSGQAAGHLEIAWDAGEFLRTQTRDEMALGYEVLVQQTTTSISHCGHPEGSSARIASQKEQSTADFREYGLNWTVSLNRSRSAKLERELQLPLAVLFGGILFAVSLALAIHAALRARMRSQLAETMAAELRLAHARSRAIFDQTFQFIGLMSTDGTLLEANRTALEFAGIDECTVLGKFFWETPWWAHSHELQARLRDAIQRAAQGEMIRFEATHPGADGRLSTVDFSLKPVRNEYGQVCLLIPEGRDITERLAAEAQLRTSEKRLELAIRGTSDGIWDWNIATGEVYYSPRYKQLLGYSEAEFSDRLESFAENLHPADAPRVWAASHLNLEEGVPYDVRMRLRTKSGEYRWFRSRGDAVRDLSGRAVRMAGSMSDVTHEVQAEQDLTRAARLDKLTGLPNRALLMDRLQHTIDRAAASGTAHYALMFLDFDRFKFVNDCLGHEVGDALLQAIAARLQQNVRGVDSVSCVVDGNTAARLGGDEFVVLLDGLTDFTAALSVADRLLAAFAAPYQLGEHEVYSTASIGIAFGDLVYRAAGEVLRDADLAMYEAKRAGKARYSMFDASCRAELLRRQRLECDLRKAVELEQLDLRYQPVVSLSSGEVSEVEVRLTWNHPQEGWIGDTELVALAEESELIHQLGNWKLRTACRQLRDWQQESGSAAPRLLCLHISYKEFARREWLEEIRQLLCESGISPACLQLEIDERTLGRDAAATITSLNELRRLGVQLSLSGFGGAGGSLAAIHRLPVHAIKTHPALIEEIENCKYAASLVHALAVLLRNLEVRVVITGIERASQLLALQELGCGYGQGSLIAQPLTAAELTERCAPAECRVAGAMLFAQRLADYMQLDRSETAT